MWKIAKFAAGVMLLTLLIQVIVFTWLVDSPQARDNLSKIISLTSNIFLFCFTWSLASMLDERDKKKKEEKEEDE